MKLLILTPRFPYPPIKGDKLRPYHFIRQLSKSHEITLVSIVDDEITGEELKHMQQYCKRVETCILPPMYSRLKCLNALVTGLPLQVEYYYSTKIKIFLEQLVREENPDILFSVLIRTAHYFKNFQFPKIVDFVDAIAWNYRNELKFQNRFTHAWKIWEAGRIEKYEKDILNSFDHAFVTTRIDKNAIEDSDKITILPNGVDLDYFQYGFNPNSRNKIIFTGNMEYAPNVDAVVYFANSIFPLIRLRIPNLEFIIAGVSPSKKVRKLASINGILVKGYVENMHSCLLEANVYICPMRFGAGIKNKLLEAMSSGIPIVSTTLGCDGLEIENNKQVLLANTPQDFADKIALLLNNLSVRENLAREARSFVEKHYRWEKLTDILNQTLTQVYHNHRIE